MTYERFKELWDALVTNRLRSSSRGNCISSLGSSTGMEKHTADVLIAYGKGDTSLMDASRKRLEIAKATRARAAIEAH